MSYQALARKWRPRLFDDLVGQEHVVRALANALDRDRLHHAYLFTGIRGVGKTTLARIFAKALNCEQGIGSHPCGICTTCREIDSGRCVDLLEIDAASRTKVEQTRELLENVPYAPVRARFKVYLIDEVHMFSAHSFNALLKTLEEPPPHVKFLFATTDPQKIPVTVLSRCLQFNLRRLLPAEISARLAYVLEQEGIPYEPGALPLIARAADGSLRDALSLLDQAIAFGGGQVGEADTRTMLGTISGDLVFAIAWALAQGDGAALLDQVARAASLTPDFVGLLRELIALLHRLALIQQVPASLVPDDPDRQRLQDLAAAIAPEDIQLFYEIALLGQNDLMLAPDPRTGLEMVLLRALAFRPAGTQPPCAARQDTPDIQPRLALASKSPDPTPTPGPSTALLPLKDMDDWQRLIANLGLGGIARELAHHCVFRDHSAGRLRLQLDPNLGHLQVPNALARLKEAIERALGTPVILDIQLGTPDQETLAQRQARAAAARQQAAVARLDADPVAQALREQLEADWRPGSIRPDD
ncbi:DNA polymerase III subunit gamma/tau [Caldichromatium japonicum]|uniref:DNA polymerase III subunit gamma/tau n=1 Tax=Caldichromatium japonicum TaxID=2699430 RepID=A0A6G7VCT4_9GAMM|nr:DNA polymerase III subunit gamma/tau [Caldichromatium japonicum]QIK37831.1 DNA polymerase III subunit gamma/tau [Caldichromatium japonicum]